MSPERDGDRWGRTLWDLIHEDFVERFPRLYTVFVFAFIVVLMGTAAYLVMDISKTVAAVHPSVDAKMATDAVVGLKDKIYGGEVDWVGQGVKAIEDARYEEAIDAFDNAIALNASDSKAWRYKGMAFLEMGSIGEALVCLNKSIESDPSDEEAWYVKGNVLYDLGRYQEATDCYDHAVMVNPEFGTGWYALGRARDLMGGYQEAVSAYDKALALMGEVPKEEIWTDRGLALASMGLYDEALSSYDSGLQVNSSYGEAWYQKGMTLMALGRMDEAKEAFRRAEELGMGPSPINSTIPMSIPSQREVSDQPENLTKEDLVQAEEGINLTASDPDVVSSEPENTTTLKNITT
jgi:Flp pilus assembly protein TadD